MNTLSLANSRITTEQVLFISNKVTIERCIISGLAGELSEALIDWEPVHTIISRLPRIFGLHADIPL
jgi:hypothetical protein